MWLLVSGRGQRWHVSISLPNSFRRLADGSQRIVSLVENFFSAGDSEFLAIAYALQLMRWIAAGVVLNFSL